MRITGNDKSGTPGRARQAADSTSANDTGAKNASECRALIAIGPATSASHSATIVRQPAGFLAQLIATQQLLPQTRERRRIDPQVGAAIYAEAGRPTEMAASHILRRAA